MNSRTRRGGHEEQEENEETQAIEGIEEGQMSRTRKECIRKNGKRALKRQRQAEEKRIEARNSMEPMT